MDTLYQQELHLAKLTETKARIESNLAISSELELYSQQAEQATQQYVGIRFVIIIIIIIYHLFIQSIQSINQLIN